MKGGGRFSYASLSTGLAGLAARSSGWGLGFQDFDNDGWKDLFVAQSHVLDNVERINSALRYLEPPALYRNAGGRFEKVDLGTLPAVAGRGAAFGDLNNDGAMDVVMPVLGGRPVVVSRPARIRTTGLRSSWSGHRARATDRGRGCGWASSWAYATTSGSYLSASDSRVHFGLGEEKTATVEIRVAEREKTGAGERGC